MIDVTLEKMTEADLPDIMAIEHLVFTTPWSESMFRQEIRGVFNSHSEFSLSQVAGGLYSSQPASTIIAAQRGSGESIAATTSTSGGSGGRAAVHFAGGR